MRGEAEERRQKAAQCELDRRGQLIALDEISRRTTRLSASARCMAKHRVRAVALATAMKAAATMTAQTQSKAKPGQQKQHVLVVPGGDCIHGGNGSSPTGTSDRDVPIEVVRTPKQLMQQLETVMDVKGDSTLRSKQQSVLSTSASQRQDDSGANTGPTLVSDAASARRRRRQRRGLRQKAHADRTHRRHSGTSVKGVRRTMRLRSNSLSSIHDRVTDSAGHRSPESSDEQAIGRTAHHKRIPSSELGLVGATILGDELFEDIFNDTVSRRGHKARLRKKSATRAGSGESRFRRRAKKAKKQATVHKDDVDLKLTRDVSIKLYALNID